MMSHPTEDELIQYGMGDVPANVRADIEAHVRLCAACRAVIDEVEDSLQLAWLADVPEPDADFENRMWARIAPELPARRAVWGVRQLVPLGAWAAVLIGAVALSVTSLTRHDAPPAAVLASPEGLETSGGGPRRVLLAALDEHFAQTEVLLVELLNAPAPAADSLTFERTTAEDLVASGRVYRETAEDTGQRQFAEIIDELEPVLVDVARSQDIVDSRELAAWRERIEDAGLLFKVRAATNEVRVRREPLASASKGAL